MPAGEDDGQIAQLIELEKQKQKTAKEDTKKIEAATRKIEAETRLEQEKTRLEQEKNRLEQEKQQTIMLTKQSDASAEKKLSPDEIMDKVYADAKYTPPVRKPVTPQEKKKS